MKFKEIDIIEQLQRFWEWVIGIKYWNTLEGWVARILVWAIICYLLLLFTKHLLEIVAKISKSCKTLGIKVRTSPKELARLRRRQQFCKVLGSDLATLAKAESWNDQFFTDLEAEVEAEGGYYANPVDRLLRRKSQGLRRVPSLIQAIESSTEQCLLVTGEPGSGKSVALRHLAAQLAEKASKSKSTDEKIPLYLNLKELPDSPVGGPSADFIKEFVLENIRRGDADTAAYVRENWQIYRDRGHWFFLFDSFDEIPAVLHAPTGSSAIREHADAIRQFFEGMSACQGVLASREFKGPDALPWKKFKILPLSSLRQEELIANSFLPPEQMTIAAQHVASSGSGFLTNPLFLTLLCRYVKEENRPPTNDNELLLRHLSRLANREPDYVKRRYGFNPSELIAASIRLSVLFAEQPSLSLAPTQDQISAALAGERLPGDSLEKLLAALIDVKIGRCDVKEARAGDRRFTFGHRRYQETLFVQHLSNNPSYLPPEALLTDLRWRDYTVTLLQTSSFEVISPFLVSADRLLKEYASKNWRTPVIPAYGSQIYYFSWKDYPGVQLLRLLQEGLGRRLEIVSKELRGRVKEFLDAPWNDGDSFDRLMVISLGGLLPEDNLSQMIKWAIESGTVDHCDAAVTSSFFLTEIPDDLVRWLRVELANRLLIVRQRPDILRLEAIAARAPKNIGAPWIIARTRKLRSYFRTCSLAVQASDRLYSKAFRRSRAFRSFSELLHTNIAVLAATQAYLSTLGIGALAVSAAVVSNTTRVGGWCLSACVIWVFLRLLTHLWLFLFRAVGDQLNLKSISNEIGQMSRQVTKAFLGAAKGIVVLIAVYCGTGAVFHILFLVFGYKRKVWPLYAFGPAATIVVIVITGVAMLARDQRRSRVRLRLARETTKTKVALILRASSWSDASNWTDTHITEVIPSAADARSFLRFIDAVSKGVFPLNRETSLENNEAPEKLARNHLIHRLITKFLEFEAAGTDKSPVGRPGVRP
jgi:hypothetical protein